MNPPNSPLVFDRHPTSICESSHSSSNSSRKSTCSASPRPGDGYLPTNLPLLRRMAQTAHLPRRTPPCPNPSDIPPIYHISPSQTRDALETYSCSAQANPHPLANVTPPLALRPHSASFLSPGWSPPSPGSRAPTIAINHLPPHAATSSNKINRNNLNGSVANQRLAVPNSYLERRRHRLRPQGIHASSNDAKRLVARSVTSTPTSPSPLAPDSAKSSTTAAPNHHRRRKTVAHSSHPPLTVRPTSKSPSVSKQE